MSDAHLREDDYRNLAESLPQLAWIAEADGNIVWYNQRWYDYTGTTLESMQGWGWRSIHHPDHLERVEARFRRAFETGEPWEDTFPLKGPTGSTAGSCPGPGRSAMPPGRSCAGTAPTPTSPAGVPPRSACATPRTASAPSSTAPRR